MEEVPDVLPLWRQYAAILRAWGFSMWTGILNAADYGVPQTRKRAILLASRVRTAEPPAPTHARAAEPESLFGPGRRTLLLRRPTVTSWRRLLETARTAHEQTDDDSAHRKTA